MDNPFVQCPYNKEHRVSRSRLQQHIVKCAKQYPPLAICPYNATHRYPADQIKDHVTKCPSKQSWNIEEDEKKVEVPDMPEPDMPEPDPDDDGEDWDA